MRASSPSGVDVAVAASFVLAGAAEAVVTRSADPGLMALGLGGAPALGVLAVRRTRPVLCVSVLCLFAIAGTLAQLTWWPDADDSGGVWIFALLLACYSLGSHARGGVLALGALLPLAVVLCTDLTTSSGWMLVNGVLFVTVFVGVLPTLVGRLVRLRRNRLHELAEQRDRIVADRQTRREAAVLTERLRATERLRPALLDGLRGLAAQAESGTDPGSLETAARALLTRTREEVVALTRPVETSGETSALPAPDHLRLLRGSAQRWTALGAGVIAAALAMETTYTGHSQASQTLTLTASVAVGLPFALLPWRPVTSAALVWIAASAYSQGLMPLTGTISQPTLALSTAFAVAALSTRTLAVWGLAVCLAGLWVGGSGSDALGAGLLMVVSWLGGRAVQEASRLVEQSRANNAVLADQEAEQARRAIVEERFRIARDVHDQLGHSLTVVALQAGAARRLQDAEPERSGELLATIAAAARAGVAAVDRVDTGGTDPGSTDLADLLDSTRAAGLRVTADLAHLGGLDPQHRLVVFRVVQEALTNVLRHAPGATATVHVAEGPDGLRVHVGSSPGAGPGAGPGTGRGLSGLRERVEAVGGTLTWGSRPDGGFDVEAALPAVLAGAVR